MSQDSHLYPEERAFFGLLVETVHANPFGSDQERLDHLLGQEASSGVVSQADHYIELLPVLEDHLAVLHGRGLTRLERIHPEDRELMRQVFLFHCYQRHIPDFDALIQSRIGDAAHPVVLPGGDIIAQLRAYGFSAVEAQRFVALYYQLRRAYYFIEQSLVGSSQSMRELRRALWNSVFTHDLRTYSLLLWERMEDFSTLLLGETGTGKGSAAAAIGRSGPIPFDPRSNRFARCFSETFIATNLSQFPESLIESELFGHRKGAFTGAVEHHEGLFGRCDAHGALFLDEIGDVTLPVQTKLLNVLQDRGFTPVGSHTQQRFQGRVIAATNRSIEELMHDGHFRRDFFYRLSSNIIRVPPLRERLADSPRELGELVEVLLARMVGTAAGALHERVMDALDTLPRAYPWPGNVRELEQALRRIILNGHYAPDPLPTGGGNDPWLSALEAGGLDAAALLAGYCQRLHQRLGTYEAVAKATGLDRRTVKRHIDGYVPLERDPERYA